MPRKIFITGAAGFIGFHLARALNRRGDLVYGYDNFNDYYSVNLKKSRCDILKKEGILVLPGDICDKETLKNAIVKHEATHIVHLAAQAGVRYSLENPEAYLSSNVDGFLNVLEICRSQPALKLIYASSSSVYGLNSKTPFSIHDPTDQPASLYGATKKANELMASTYRHLFGISSIGLRFFTVYGPWGRPDMAYYSFTKDILSGKPIKVFNHGMMKRDFTYIDDIVDGIIASLDYQGQNTLFNLGNHQPVELETMISTLEELLGKKAKKEHLPMQQGDVIETYADIVESQKELNFAPKTPLEDGLAQFVDWYLSYKL